MTKTAYLVLGNGAVFEGERFGAAGEVNGEIVFTTGMTGYIETLTDPSYYGQIILQTFPLIGNVGMISEDYESQQPLAAAYIVKYPCDEPSNFRSEGSLDAYLKKHNIVGICHIDTRAITKIIREYGVMHAKITDQRPAFYSGGLERSAEKVPTIDTTIHEAVSQASGTEPQYWASDNAKYTVALLDFGYKKNIRSELLKRGCNVWVLPSSCTAAEVLKIKPDGIMLSNGPGDPVDNMDSIEQLKILLQTNTPIFGICLGHQLLALAHGFVTEKLKYGHRGANQPVRDSESGRVYITSQNHGYAVSSGSINPAIATHWLKNVNDDSCEGLKYIGKAVFSVQFHPEACGGPHDTNFLFDSFISLIREKQHAAG